MEYRLLRACFNIEKTLRPTQNTNQLIHIYINKDTDWSHTEKNYGSANSPWGLCRSSGYLISHEKNQPTSS